MGLNLLFCGVMNLEQLIVMLNIKMDFNIMQNNLYLYNYKIIVQ